MPYTISNKSIRIEGQSCTFALLWQGFTVAELTDEDIFSNVLSSGIVSRQSSQSMPVQNKPKQMEVQPMSEGLYSFRPIRLFTPKRSSLSPTVNAPPPTTSAQPNLKGGGQKMVFPPLYFADQRIALMYHSVCSDNSRVRLDINDSMRPELTDRVLSICADEIAHGPGLRSSTWLVPSSRTLVGIRHIP
ncbi:hypothetical protein CPB84DRAFT_1913972 [Gymnopilus junonius]|uniref:Uncharacterized protein n=1 Tax=Gymnopilus junonius TaxID=109634 RepID=A0A9P5N838_GYMJU|nr:hypothetical protein CPB84DRAFT_1913972 [Gymnopilus junonius]